MYDLKKWVDKVDSRIFTADSIKIVLWAACFQSWLITYRGQDVVTWAPLATLETRKKLEPNASRNCFWDRYIGDAPSNSSRSLCES